jgi:hypothetical protein
MAKFNPFFTLLFITVITLVGCKDDEPTNSNLKFLETNSKWTYKYREYDIDANLINTNDNLAYYKNDWKETKDALCFYSGNVVGIFDDFPMIYKNYYKNQKWNYTYRQNEIWTREVVSINETINVQAGTFTDCIKIVETNSCYKNNEIVFYISAKHGMIMREFKGYIFTLSGDSYYHKKYELISFE